MTTAAGIATLREKLGVTQQELALRLGVTITSVSRYENGRQPTRRVLGKLSAVAGSAGLTDLQGFFEAQRTAGIAARIRNLPSAGTQRRVSLDDLESWINFVGTIAATLEEQSNLMESSGRHIPRDCIGLPTKLFYDILGSIRRASGTAGYIADELKLYVGEPDTTKIRNERKRGKK